jgi:hypothetical protein
VPRAPRLGDVVLRRPELRKDLAVVLTEVRRLELEHPGELGEAQREPRYVELAEAAIRDRPHRAALAQVRMTHGVGTDNTGAHGTRAASSATIAASASANPWSHSSTSATTSSRRAHRAALSAKRPSSASSGRCIAAHNRGHWSGATMQITTCHSPPSKMPNGHTA